MPKDNFIIKGEAVDTHSKKILKKLAQLPNIQVSEGRVNNDELPELFGNATAIILPYVSATQSGIPALAHSFCLPVAVTNVGALPNLIKSGYSGVVLEPDNVTSWPNLLSKQNWTAQKMWLWDNGISNNNNLFKNLEEFRVFD